MSGYSAPRPISDGDDLARFDSGESSLDEYLRTRALANHIDGASRCFVTCRDGRVVGFYALSGRLPFEADAWKSKVRTSASAAWKYCVAWISNSADTRSRR